MAEKNIDKIIDKDTKNFILDYYGIDNVVLKKGVFEQKLAGEYPLIRKKSSFHFPKEKQYNFESIFSISC